MIPDKEVGDGNILKLWGDAISSKYILVPAQEDNKCHFIHFCHLKGAAVVMPNTVVVLSCDA